MRSNLIKKGIACILALGLIIVSEAGVTTIWAEDSIQQETSTVINDLEFTITEVREDEETETASDEMKIIDIALKVKNGGAEQEQLTAIMMFKLFDLEENQYNIVLPEPKESVNGLIDPQNTIEGTISFKVPKEKQEFRLFIRPSLMKEETGSINIQLGEVQAE